MAGAPPRLAGLACSEEDAVDSPGLRKRSAVVVCVEELTETGHRTTVAAPVLCTRTRRAARAVWFAAFPASSTHLAPPQTCFAAECGVGSRRAMDVEGGGSGCAVTVVDAIEELDQSVETRSAAVDAARVEVGVLAG